MEGPDSGFEPSNGLAERADNGFEGSNEWVGSRGRRFETSGCRMSGYALAFGLDIMDQGRKSSNAVYWLKISLGVLLALANILSRNATMTGK